MNFSEQSALALSQRDRRYRVRPLADPDMSELWMVRRWQTELFSGPPSSAPDLVGLAARCSNYPLQEHSPQPAQDSHHPRPQRFGSEVSKRTFLMSGPPRPWEMDLHARRWRVRELLLQATLWATSMNEKDAILQANNCRWLDPDSGSNNNADFQLSLTQPVAWRSKAPPTALAQPVQMKSRPPRGSGSTVAQVRPESNSSTTTQPSPLRCTLPQKKHL